MARPIRFAKPWQPVEVTARTIQGRFLLAPSPRLNALLVGILALARERYRVRIHNFVFLSNHFHLLVSAACPRDLSGFMGFVMSNIAREAGRLHDWSGPFWGKRYTAIPIEDEASLLDRMRYLFANGCKEGMVSHPSHWIGLNAVRALTSGAVLEGIWVDRTRLALARRRKNDPADEADFTTHHRLVLDPLPIWSHLGPSEQRRRAASLVEDAAHEARGGPKAPPSAAVLGLRSPHHRPEHVKQARAPLCHAATRQARAAFRRAYLEFAEAYRRASAHLRDNLAGHGYPTHAQVLAFAMEAST